MGIDRILQELKEECSFFLIKEDIQDEEYIEEEKMWETILTDFITGLESENMSDYAAKHYIQAFNHVLMNRRNYLREEFENVEADGNGDGLLWGSLYAVVLRCSRLVKQLSSAYDDKTADYKILTEYSCSRRGATLLEKKLGPLAEFEELLWNEEKVYDFEATNHVEASTNTAENISDEDMETTTRAEYIKNILTDECIENLSEIVSEKEAFSLYRIAANYGSDLAKYKLGLCYKYGRGTQADYEKAFIAFSEATEHSVPGAICALGRMYRSGEYVKADTEEARSLFIRAKDLSKGELDDSDMQLAYAEAMLGLGEIQFRPSGEMFGHETFHYFSEAIYYFQKCKDKWLRDSSCRYQAAKRYVKELAHYIDE